MPISELLRQVSLNKPEPKRCLYPRLREDKPIQLAIYSHRVHRENQRIALFLAEAQSDSLDVFLFLLCCL